MPTTNRATVIRRLRALERDWPQGLMLFASGSGGNLILCEGHPEDGGKIIATFDIPSDGGDPDWAPDSDLTDIGSGKKQPVKFREPSKPVRVGPRPRFTG